MYLQSIKTVKQNAAKSVNRSTERKADIQGLVSLQFIRPWRLLFRQRITSAIIIKIQFASGMDEGTLKTPTNPLISSFLVIFVWDGEAMLQGLSSECGIAHWRCGVAHCWGVTYSFLGCCLVIFGFTGAHWRNFAQLIGWQVLGSNLGPAAWGDSSLSNGDKENAELLRIIMQ